MESEKIAIITGGTSGMGYEVAKSLPERGFTVFILGSSLATGESAVRGYPELKFRQVNVADWSALSASFDDIFNEHGRIDFVFANAGMWPKEDFYARDDSLPPAEPCQIGVDVNLKAVINTTHLARHYFLAGPAPNPVLVITASIGSFYARELNPLYTATKAGVLGFMRSIAAHYHSEGIRVYAICPGPVRTRLLTSEAWNRYPQDHIAPMELVVSTVNSLIQGGDMSDSKGKHVTQERNFGLAVEIVGNNVFFRDQMDFANGAVREICESASFTSRQRELRADPSYS